MFTGWTELQWRLCRRHGDLFDQARSICCGELGDNLNPQSCNLRIIVQRCGGGNQKKREKKQQQSFQSACISCLRYVVHKPWWDLACCCFSLSQLSKTHRLPKRHQGLAFSEKNTEILSLKALRWHIITLTWMNKLGSLLEEGGVGGVLIIRFEIWDPLVDHRVRSCLFWSSACGAPHTRGKQKSQDSKQY